MKKIISCLTLVCFFISYSGIALAAPKTAIPPVEDAYIEAIMDSVTSIKKDVITIDYEGLVAVLESYTGLLPDIKPPKSKLPKPRNLPELKIEMGRYTAWLGGNVPGFIDITYVCNAAEFVGNDVTVTFEAADLESQAVIDAYPTLFDIPEPQTLNVVTVISVEGEATIIGNPFRLSDPYFINISILSEDGEWELKSHKILTSGSRSNLYFGLGETLKTTTARLLTLEKELQAYVDPQANMSIETIDNFLSTLNSLYFGILSYYKNYSASLMDVAITPTLSIGYATRCVQRHRTFFFKTWLLPGTVQLDVSVNGTDVSGPDTLKFYPVFGAVATNSESFAIELLAGIPAISTGRIFLEAVKQEIPIYTVDPIDGADSLRIMNELQLSETAKISMHNYIHTWGEDRIAICPQRQVTINGALTEGWILYDRRTGHSSYIIPGNLHGGAGAPGAPGEPDESPFDDAAEDVAEAVGRGVEFLDAIAVGHTSALAGGAHIFGGLIVANAFAGSSLAVPAMIFGGLSVVIGTTLLAVGVVTAMMLINNALFSCVLTTREGYYA